jgi:hypothetical protein
MRSAASDLSLEHLWIVYPGSEAYPVEKNISTLPLRDLGKVRNLLLS